MRDAGDSDLSSTSAWSPAASASEFLVEFEPRLDAMSGVLDFVRVTRCGEAILGTHLLWRRHFDRRCEASATFDWMQERQDQWHLWGRLAGLIGPDALLAAAAADVAKARSGRAADLLRTRNEARAARKREQEISSYLVEKHGQYGVDLRRGGHRKSFFVVWFRESWERERFRDWWGPQHHRFAEFAALHDAQGASALERLLLREMQDTEKRIKAAGLGAGGRRPLRFYRGEE